MHLRLAYAVLAVLASLVVTPGKAADRNGAQVEEFAASRQAGPPLLAIVSLSQQRVTIYDAEGRILRSPVSTGQTGYETPAGIYTVIQKEREHYSNIYDDAAMPFMQRITWSGIALHAGVLPGYAASHGCVRMPYGFAERLFDLTSLGLRVVLVRNDMSPVEISHPTLFKPGPVRQEIASQGSGLPMRLGAGGPSNPPTSRWEMLKAAVAAKAVEAETAARKAEEARLLAARRTGEAGRDAKLLRAAGFMKARAETQLKYAESELANAKTPEAQRLAEENLARARKRLEAASTNLATLQTQAEPKLEIAARAREEVKAAEMARRTAIEEAKVAQRKLTPISVFISRATQRLYVRQAFEPILETDVVIRDADRPIGTTVFTALAHGADGNVRWSALGMYARGKGPDVNKVAHRGAERNAEATPTDLEDAKAVLDRIEIPQAARDLISEVVAPGSSLIISDEAASRETSKGTDFVVLLSGEPQGGIKIRARYAPRYRSNYYGSSWW